MGTIKLSDYGTIITTSNMDRVSRRINEVLENEHSITLDFANVKGIDSEAAQTLLSSFNGRQRASVQMKNASPLVRSTMMYSSGATISSAVGGVKVPTGASVGASVRGKSRFNLFRMFAMITLLLTLV